MYTRQLFLDVTILAPREKHPRIFELFDALNEKESLLIYNDHDPKPLYYQMIAERGKTFYWKYIEKGPEVWRVEIIKSINEEGDLSIGEICSKDLRKAQVFKKYGIDFCCGGKKSIKQVCKEQNLDLKEVIEALETKNGVENNIDFLNLELDNLIDYIIINHHEYVYQNLPPLLSLGEKVSTIHGRSNPELKRIYQLIQEANNELILHQHKEEKVLFPTLLKLQALKSHTLNKDKLLFDTLRTPLNIMEMEHESLGEIIHEIKHLSNNYHAPIDACNSYKLFYTLLEEFENNITIHMHLENNILFPKSLELEKSLAIKVI